MSTVLHIGLILAIVFVAFLGITFFIYFFNVDMKLMAKLEPFFTKHYDKVKRDKHL